MAKGTTIQVNQADAGWTAEDFQPQGAVAEIAHLRATLNCIVGLIGNVDHSAGGGENTAGLYGGMLNDIRDIARTAAA